MDNYYKKVAPEDRFENSKLRRKYPVTDNREFIKDTLRRNKSNAIKLINNAYNKKVKSLKNAISKIPDIYRNIRSNFTLTNNKENKDMNEYIANRGNHMAGGYAISEKMNNINYYNNGLKDINLKEQEEIRSRENEILNAKDEADNKREKLNITYQNLLLKNITDETERIDSYFERRIRDLDNNEFKEEELNEEKRMNDSEIKKNDNDILLDNKEDKRRDNEDRRRDNEDRRRDNEDKRKDKDDKRKQEEHDIKIKYMPEKEQAEINKIKSETNRNNAPKSTSKGGVKSGKTSVNNSTSKLSAKDLASAAKNYAKYITFDEAGNEVYGFYKGEAKRYIKRYQEKYNLSDQVVNDAFIILGL